jgi:Cdc6-like AAA superfamily ATPase
MPIFHSNSTFTLCSAAAMFALLFYINCTEINQSSNICMYIISTVNTFAK